MNFTLGGKNVIFAVALVLLLAVGQSPAFQIANVNARSHDGPNTQIEMILSVDKRTLDVGESLEIRGVLRERAANPPQNKFDQGDKTVFLTYDGPVGTYYFNQLKTGNDGTFSDIFTPTEAGGYLITGSWGGNGIDLGRLDSLPLIIAVLSIFAIPGTPSAPAESKESNTISIKLANPPRGGDYDSGDDVVIKGTFSRPVSGTVTLTYTRPDGTTFTRTTSATDGSFTYTYAAIGVGDWSVVATFGGNDTYESSRSTELSFVLSKSFSTSGSNIFAVVFWVLVLGGILWWSIRRDRQKKRRRSKNEEVVWSRQQPAPVEAPPVASTSVAPAAPVVAPQPVPAPAPVVEEPPAEETKPKAKPKATRTKKSTKDVNFCPSCGIAVDKGAEFCHKCGTELG